MTEEELTSKVWQIIDDFCLDMSQQEYHDFLITLMVDANIRVEAIENDMYINI